MMNDHSAPPETAAEKDNAWPLSSPEEPMELTPKEELEAVTLARPDAELAKVEKKLEAAATTANLLPKSEQLAEFEKKLDHDDSGNQGS